MRQIKLLIALMLALGVSSNAVYAETAADFMGLGMPAALARALDHSDIDSTLTPGADDTYDLGSASSEWKDLYVDGTANVDTLSVSGTATIASRLYLTDVTTGITAAGTGQGDCTALTTTINKVTGGTAATADGVCLPTAAAGAVVVVINEGGFALEVWPASSDAIDDGAANAVSSVADNAVAIFFAIDATTWSKLEN